MRKTILTALLAAVVTTCLVAPAEARKAKKNDAAHAPTEADKDDGVPSILEATFDEEVAGGAPDEDALWAEADDAENLVACGDGVDCGDGVAVPWWCTGRWSVLSELTLLQPSYASTTYSTDDNRGFVGPRLSIAWEAPNGFGIRGRAWGFNNAANLDRTPNGSNTTLLVDELTFSANKFDLDFYRRIEHGTGTFLFGAGLAAGRMTLTERHVYLQQDYFPVAVTPEYGWYYNDDSFQNYLQFGPSTYMYSEESGVSPFSVYGGSHQVQVSGAGPQLLVEGTHRLYDGPACVWSLIGRGRTAYLIGQFRAPGATTGRTEGDANMAVAEAAFGTELRRRFAAFDMALSCSFEVQSWDMSLVNRVNLAGVTTGLGVDW